MKGSIDLLGQLVKFLTEEKKNGEEAIKSIVAYSNPIFNNLKNKLNNKYRVFFINLDEMNSWLRAKGFTPVDKKSWDSKEFMEWLGGTPSDQKLLHISAHLFDKNGFLVQISPENWSEAWVYITDYPEPDPQDTGDDEIPF